MAVKALYPLRRGEWAVNELLEKIAALFPDMEVIAANAKAMGTASPQAAICRYCIAVYIRQVNGVIQKRDWRPKGERLDDRDIWEIGTWWYERRGIL